MKTIRYGVFETNSSSTHSFCIGWGIFIDNGYSDYWFEEELDRFVDEKKLTEKERERIRIENQGQDEYYAGCLLYLFDITEDKLNNNIIPQATEDDKKLMEKLVKLFENEQSPKWHSVEYYGYN